MKMTLLIFVSIASILLYTSNPLVHGSASSLSSSSSSSLLSNSSITTNVPSTTRVTPIIFSSSTCSTSATHPIILTPPTSCPCFLRYIIACDLPTTWDIYFMSEVSYIRWLAVNFQGDPSSYVSAYSTLQARTYDSLTILFTPDTLVMNNGTYRLFIRTNTNERRCFSDPLNVRMPTSIVLEPVPSPCPILTRRTSRSATTMTTVNRITGGSFITDDENDDGNEDFKWMAKLIQRSSNQLVCSTVLISKLGYALTAAHCTVNIDVSNYEDYEVQFGSNDKTRAYWINRIFNHEDFQTNDRFNSSYNNDISIIELYRFRFDSRRLSTIAVNSNEDIPTVSSYATVAGYGSPTTSWSSTTSELSLLRRVDVPVVSHERCVSSLSTATNVLTNISESLHLCAGPISDSGSDSEDSSNNCIGNVCDGDDGSALRYVHPEHGTHVLIGIVSSNLRCDLSPAQPAIYTRVSTFASWINTTVIDAHASRTDLQMMFWQKKWAVALVFSVVCILIIGAVTVGAIVYIGKLKKDSRRYADADLENTAPKSYSGSDMPSETGISE